MHLDWSLIALAGVLILGVSAQLLAWRSHLPSILLLLAFGFLAGPGSHFIAERVGFSGPNHPADHSVAESHAGADDTEAASAEIDSEVSPERPWQFIDPDQLLGEDLLFSFITLAVALILFEGALQLRMSELEHFGGVLLSILTVGVVITGVLATLGAIWVLQFPVSLALLLGFLLTVTGPTVIGPILRQVRPSGRIGGIARWEGIVVDPIGAILAVLVFEAQHELMNSDYDSAITTGLIGIAKTSLVGFSVGLAAAGILVWLLWRRQLPDHLQSPFALILVLAACVLSNSLQHESGLIAVTVMGIVVTNQHRVDIRHIFEFKETLTILLVSTLFILLSARVRVEDITALGWRGPAFVLFLVVIVRPVAIWISAHFSDLSWREKTFLTFLAPRGIVAAAVASVFAIKLEQDGVAEAGLIVPATFQVIVGTVTIYGLLARPLAYRLELAFANPQGCLIASGHPGARAIALALREAGFIVRIVDVNFDNIQAARMEGIPVHHGNVLSEQTEESIDLGGIGRLLALTANDEVNALAALQYSELFGRDECYQLVPQRRAEKGEKQARHLQGRYLFGPEMTYNRLDALFEDGYIVKATRLSEKFTYERFEDRYNGDYLLLFVVDVDGNLNPLTEDEPVTPVAGEMVLALVRPPSPEN